MTDKKRDLIITIVLSAIVAVLVVLGFNVAVVPIIQPENPEARAIRERISIDTRDDVYLYGGAKAYWFSDDHATQKVLVDGAAGAVRVNATAAATGTPGMFIHAGIGNAVEVVNAAGTRVFDVGPDGSATYSGFSSGGGAVTGDTAITGRLTASEGITTAGVLLVTGTTSLNGGLNMDGDTFEVANTSGNTRVKGTLLVTGATSLQTALNMNNAVINNIGAAATDFDTAGGLALAGGLTAAQGITSSSTISVAGNMQVQGNMLITGTIANGAITLSPVRAISATIINGGTIAHGMGTAAVIGSCSVVHSNNLTVTAYISATDATNITVGLFDLTGAAWGTPTPVNCIVGK